MVLNGTRRRVLCRCGLDVLTGCVNVVVSVYSSALQPPCVCSPTFWCGIPLDSVTMEDGSGLAIHRLRHDTPDAENRSGIDCRCGGQVLIEGEVVAPKKGEVCLFLARLLTGNRYHGL